MLYTEVEYCQIAELWTFIDIIAIIPLFSFSASLSARTDHHSIVNTLVAHNIKTSSVDGVPAHQSSSLIPEPAHRSLQPSTTEPAHQSSSLVQPYAAELAHYLVQPSAAEPTHQSSTVIQPSTAEPAYQSSSLILPSASERAHQYSSLIQQLSTAKPAHQSSSLSSTKLAHLSSSLVRSSATKPAHQFSSLIQPSTAQPAHQSLQPYAHGGAQDVNRSFRNTKSSSLHHTNTIGGVSSACQPPHQPSIYCSILQLRHVDSYSHLLVSFQSSKLPLLSPIQVSLSSPHH